MMHGDISNKGGFAIGFKIEGSLLHRKNNTFFDLLRAKVQDKTDFLFTFNKRMLEDIYKLSNIPDVAIYLIAENRDEDIYNAIKNLPATYIEGYSTSSIKGLLNGDFPELKLDTYIDEDEKRLFDIRHTNAINLLEMEARLL